MAKEYRAVRHVDEIKDGLAALEAADMNIHEVGLTPGQIHDLEVAVSGNSLENYVAYMEGNPDLTDVLQALRTVRDLVNESTGGVLASVEQ